MMTWIGRPVALAAAVLTAGWVFPAHAATDFSNALTGFTGDTSEAATQSAIAAAGLSVFSTADDPAVVLDASGAHFGTAFVGDGGRNYLRTVESDYATTSFSAEITIQLSDDQQAAFFGIGAGDTALFGIPDWSTNFSSASFWTDTSNEKIVAFRTQNDINQFRDTAVPGFDPGIHRLRMEFDAGTQLLVGSIDLNFAGGAFVADVTTLPVDVASLFAADGWPSEPSRIFFGGDDGATFRDFTISVIPEPASAVLLAAGAVGLAVSRRRRR